VYQIYKVFGVIGGIDMAHPKDDKIRPNNYESTMASKLKIMEGEIKANNRDEELRSKIKRIRTTRTLNENIRKVMEFDKECDTTVIRLALA